MPIPDEPKLIDYQQQLEHRLTAFAEHDLAALFASVTDPAVYRAAVGYVTRPSKRLLGMAFLVQHDALAAVTSTHTDDLIGIAAALEIRHAAILLHDDIVDGDTHRGGQPTAHHALTQPFGPDATGAAVFAGDVLAAAFILPLLRTNLPAGIRAELAEATMELTAKVAAGQCQQLYLDTVVDVDQAHENRVLAAHAANFPPYLHCSTRLAAILTGVPEDHIRRIMDAAVPMATAFQVQNDLAGLTELERLLAGGDPSARTLANTSDLARRRRTTLIAAALTRLTGNKRQALSDYLAHSQDTPLEETAALVRGSGAVEHCTELVARLFTQSHTALHNDPHLPYAVKDAVAAAWRWMTDLYDPASPVSRLYLKARPDLAQPEAA